MIGCQKKALPASLKEQKDDMLGSGRPVPLSVGYIVSAGGVVVGPNIFPSSSLKLVTHIIHGKKETHQQPLVTLSIIPPE